MRKEQVIPIATAHLRVKIRKALRSRWRTMAMIELTIRRIVEAGNALIACKAELEHGMFEARLEAEGVIGDGPDCLSKVTVQRWMRLAKFDELNPGVLDNAATVTKAYRLADILPPIEETSTNSSLSAANYLVHLNRLSASLIAQLKARPVEQWSSAERSMTRERLRPLVEVYEELGDPQVRSLLTPGGSRGV